MKTIHYIVLGAKSPAGRSFIGSLAERGLEPSFVTAIDLKVGSMSFGEDHTINVVEPDAYRNVQGRKGAQVVLADAKPALIDVADDHLDDDGPLLDLTGHFLGDRDAVLAPQAGRLVVQPSAPSRMIERVIKSLPQAPTSIHAQLFLPASHFGKDGMDELYQQVRQFLVAEELDSGVFPKKLAFNVLPFAGAIDDNGLSAEETRVLAELRHLFPDTQVEVHAAIVPVFIGVSAQLSLGFANDINEREAVSAWRRHSASLRVIDPNSEMIAASPAEIVGDDLISISRVHSPLANRLALWLTADNTQI